MDVIYGLIPSMIVIGIVLVIILFWAIKSGQFDDLEGDAHRILLDEDLALDDKNTHNNKQSAEPVTGNNNSNKQADNHRTEDKSDK